MVKDSIVIRDSLIYKDKIVTVKLPADTVEITVPVEVNIDVKPVTVETEYAKATAWISDKKLNVRLTTKDTEIQVRIDSARQEAYYWREKYNTDQKTIIKEVKFIPKLHKFALKFSIGVVILVIGWIAWKSRKFYIKI